MARSRGEIFLADNVEEIEDLGDILRLTFCQSSEPRPLKMKVALTPTAYGLLAKRMLLVPDRRSN